MSRSLLRVIGRGLISALLVLALGGIASQGYYFWIQMKHTEADLQKVRAEDAALVEENSSLNSDLQYYTNPANLEKEVRGQNYKKQGEQMMIIVPPLSSTSSNQNQ